MKLVRDLGFFFRSLAAVVTVVWGCGMLAAPVWAQSDVSNRLSKLEQDVQRLQRQAPGGPPAAAPGSAVSPTDIETRLLSLERSIEQLTGQIEETRYKADRSAEQLKVLTDDVNLRLATLEQALGVTPAARPQAQAAPVAAPGVTPGAGPSVGDLIAEANGTATSSDGTISSTPMSAPRAPATAAAGDAAVATNGGFVVRTDASGKPLPPDPNAPPPQVASAPPAAAPVPRAAPSGAAVTGNQLAAGATDVKLPDAAPKDQYDYAFDFLKRNDYARGEVALREFLRQHPKDALAGNAQYWLGQTFYVRGNYQQAAVEFMAGYQNFPKNAKGPDNLLQLGMSLEKLNQNDGACTAFSRIAKDYPDAPDQVRTATKAERTKLKCK